MDKCKRCHRERYHWTTPGPDQCDEGADAQETIECLQIGLDLREKHKQRLITTIQSLLAWETTMGGWEAPVWQNAKDLLKELQDDE